MNRYRDRGRSVSPATGEDELVKALSGCRKGETDHCAAAGEREAGRDVELREGVSVRAGGDGR